MANADMESDSEVQFNMDRVAAGEGDVSPRTKTATNDGRDDTRYDDEYNEDTVTVPRRGPNLKPETYSGSEDWESYITHFDLCAELGRWGRREMLLTLAACLRGQARTFFMTLGTREKSSYRELTLKLRQRFSSSRQKAMWLSRLEGRRRQQGEPVAKFGDEIMQLAQRAHPDLDSYAQEAVALNQLYKSVSPEMKYRCITAECRTVAQAVEMIDTYEGIVMDPYARGPKVRTATTVEDQQTTELQDMMREVIMRIDRLEKGTREDSRLRKDQRLCIICQSPDHFMRSCPRKRQDSKGRFYGGGRQGNGQQIQEN